MTHGDRQPGFGGQGGELGFPEPGAVAIGPAAVGGDQQLGRGRVGRGGSMPPAADRGDGERGGVVIGAHADPASIGAQVIDAVWVGLAQGRVDEVVDLDLLRIPARTPFLACVLVLPNEFAG